MGFFKEDTKDYSRSVKNMLTELQTIKTTCLPNEVDNVDTKHMDKYGKKRQELMVCLKHLNEGIQTLKQKEKQSSSRNPEVISLDHGNRKTLTEAQDVFYELKEIYAGNKTKGAKKLGAEEVSRRGEEVKKLEDQINRMGGIVNPSAEKKNRSRTEQRRKDREDKQKRRKDQRRGRRKDENSDAIQFKTVEVSEKEQAFLDETNANRQQEDLMLDEIAKGLDDLKNMGQDINATLQYQNELLKEADTQLQTVAEKFETGNQKLQNLLDSQGGPSRWIPRICCFVLILALVGYMVKLFAI